MGHPIQLIQNGLFKRCLPSWDKTRNGTVEVGAGSLLLGQGESGVQTRKRLNPLPALHLEIAGVGALPQPRADPLVEGSLFNVSAVRVLGTSLGSALLKDFTE